MICCSLQYMCQVGSSEAHLSTYSSRNKFRLYSLSDLPNWRWWPEGWKCHMLQVPERTYLAMLQVSKCVGNIIGKKTSDAWILISGALSHLHSAFAYSYPCVVIGFIVLVCCFIKWINHWFSHFVNCLCICLTSTIMCHNIMHKPTKYSFRNIRRYCLQAEIHVSDNFHIL